MSHPTPAVEVTLRIPGDWSSPRALVEKLPAGHRVEGDSLVLPDGEQIELVPMAPDNQFAEIFESSCRDPATNDELARVRRYTVNIGLNGQGGSMDSARVMMRAGAVIVHAGGAGVFIDNSAIAHGGSAWADMAADGSPDAVSYAFVSMVRSARELYTTGMHVLGYPDLVMRTNDLEVDAETFITVIRYVAAGEKPIGVGHYLFDENGPRFRLAEATPDEFPTGSPIHNPFGRLKLVSIKDAAEGN